MKKQMTFCFLLAALLLSILCLFSSFSLASFAQEEDTTLIHGVVHHITDSAKPNHGDIRVVNNIAYQYYKKTSRDAAHYAVVDYFHDDALIETTKKIVIEPQVDGVPVLSIEVYDFDSNIGSIPVKWKAKNVTDVVIPEGLTNIASYAFVMFPNLEKFTYPSTVTSTGYGAFENCKKLKEVSLSEGLTRISDRTFYGCTALKKIHLPTTIRQIGDKAFAKAGLKQIYIPAACEGVGKCAFAYCKDMSKVVFRNGGAARIILDSKCFQGAKTLQAVRLPGDREVALLGDVFSKCLSLKKVTNTKSITNFDNSFNNTKVTSLTLGKTVYRINKDAFEGCSALKKLRVLYTNEKALMEQKPMQLWFQGAFLSNLPATCKIYVKTAKMQKAFVNAGFEGKVIVKKDLA